MTKSQETKEKTGIQSLALGKASYEDAQAATRRCSRGEELSPPAKSQQPTCHSHESCLQMTSIPADI